MATRESRRAAELTTLRAELVTQLDRLEKLPFREHSSSARGDGPAR
jgi:hypothetical protein